MTLCSDEVEYQYFGGSSSSLHSEDGGSLDLRNIGILTRHYTMS